MSGTEELPIHTPSIPSEVTPADRRSHLIGYIPRPVGQVVGEVFLDIDSRVPKSKSVEQIAEADRDPNPSGPLETPGEGLELTGDILQSDKVDTTISMDLFHDGLQLTSDLLPRNKVETTQNQMEAAGNILLEIENAFEAEERANPTGKRLKDLRRAVVSLATIIGHRMMLSQQGSDQVLSSDVEELNRRLQHAELELTERRIKERHLMQQIHQLQAEKEELEKKAERDMAAMEESMSEFGPGYWENYTNHMVESAVKQVAGRIKQEPARPVLGGPSVTSFTPRSTFAQEAISKWKRKNSPVDPFGPAMPVRRYAASSHITDPETPPPIMKRPAKDMSIEVENLKLVIKGQDNEILKLRTQLAMPAGRISRQGSALYSTTIRNRNEPHGYGSSPLLRILSTPKSPMFRALNSAKSMHIESEIIHLIRLVENKIAQLTQSVKECTTQEETQREAIQGIHKALDEGIPRKEKLEEEIEKTASLFEHGGSSAEIQTLHNQIRETAERLGAQDEQNNRLKQESDVRRQWLESTTAQAGEMNNVIGSLNELLDWLKTREQQGRWLSAELDDAEDSEPVYTPFSEGHLLTSWPSRPAPYSAKSTLVGIADAPDMGGGRMSTRSSNVGAVSALGIPAQNAPAVGMPPLEPDVPVMDLFWRIFVNQFRAWKEIFVFVRALGRETFRYLKAIDKVEYDQTGPFNPPSIPWEEVITVAYHVQLLVTIEVYVASRRQREIWMSANALTREYMLQSHREPPAWMFIPGVDEGLILRFRDVRRFVFWLIGLFFTATSSIRDFLTWSLGASAVWTWEQLLSRR